MDFESVADELYGLLPDDFTATRTTREKEAKASGDKELAGRIRALAKPNQVAWMANLLVREDPEEVRPLLELGAGLRDASADLDAEQLREFSRQQHQLLHALVQQARRLAAAAGRRVGETAVRGVEDTLRAALVDPEAAEAVLSGRLTAGLQHSGFGPGVALAGTSTSKGAVPKQPAGAAQTSEEVARADQAVQEATSAAEGARRTREDATEEVEQAAKLVADAAGQVSRLTDELDRAVAERSRLEAAEAKRRTALAEADRTLTDAESRLTQALNQRRRLEERR